jgi:IMP cyclohydrolase
MEISFELEDSDIECVFEPDFALPYNCCDIEKVQWKFSNGTHTGTVADVFSSPADGRSTTTYILPDLRLCD